MRRVEDLVAPVEGRGRDGPRTDQEQVDHRSLDARCLAGEEVADRQPDWPDLVHAAPLGADMELPGDALERGERPGVAQDRDQGQAMLGRGLVGTAIRGPDRGDLGRGEPGQASGSTITPAQPTTF